MRSTSPAFVRVSVLLASLLFAFSASAIINVDGILDADYGTALAIQSVQTQFGDAMPPGPLTGSELDAGYAKVGNGRLYLFFAGNHEANFNNLDVFIDSRPGGENTLSGIPGYDYTPNGGISWISSNLGGLTFDAGFEADFHLFSNWSSESSPYQASFVDRNGGINAMVPGSTGSTPPAVARTAVGSIIAGNLGPNASAPSLSQNLDFAINNNNALGVSGGTGPANAAAAVAVTTGMEFSIALADLGNPAPGSTILISAMINNGDHNYLSNQFLGGLPAGTGNLGGDGFGSFTGNLSGVDLNQFAGPQYFNVRVTSPSSTVPDALTYGWVWMSLSLVLFSIGRRRIQIVRRGA